MLKHLVLIDFADVAATCQVKSSAATHDGAQYVSKSHIRFDCGCNSRWRSWRLSHLLLLPCTCVMNSVPRLVSNAISEHKSSGMR